MRSFFYVTKKGMRQFGSALFALSALSLFIVLMVVNTKAETYEYDKLNRVIKVIYDDMSYTTYEYDANGNIKSQSYSGKNESVSGNGENTGEEEKPEDGGSTGGEEPEDGGSTGEEEPGDDGNTGGEEPGTIMMYVRRH